MNEQDDIPRLDGLRSDDPPFRSNFTEQPMKSDEVMIRQREGLTSWGMDKSGPLPDIKPEQLIPKADGSEIVMTDNNDVIALIRKTAAGGQYVQVDKLIEALK